MEVPDTVGSGAEADLRCGAVGGVEHDRHLVAAVERHGQVGGAVAAVVAHGEEARRGTGGDELGRREAGIATAQQHGQVAAGVV